MGRPERPIDPAEGPLQRFAHELRQLRKSAGGLSYREMARRAHYSRTALSQAASGDELPSLAVTMAYVEACAGDQQEWKARWQALEAELAAEGTAEADVDGDSDETWRDAPYRGLAAFQSEDADQFFGRGPLVDELVSRLADTPFLAVFGASGSGKSSLLRAGLIPAVRAGRLPRSQHWPVVLLTPGEHPLEELAVQMSALQHVPSGALHAELQSDPAAFTLAVRQVLVAHPESAQLLLVVDQFEEIFTLCRDEPERAQFVQALLAAVNADVPRIRVVLGVRADFYARCANYPDLVDALRDSQVLVGPMTQDEMRSVITEPAVRAGLSVEEALVASILADARGGPATLPLVSHVLLETWKRRRGNRMTLAGYRAAGGTRGAIAQSAQAVYDGLTVAQQQIAQGIFLRLAALGEGTEATRRRVRQAELSIGQDPTVELVVQRLTAARLVTLDDEAVEVTHEALIREWPALRDWLAADRDGLRTHRQLTDAADAWESVGRDPGALYRGIRLAAARDWAEANDARLNDLERVFLASSGAQERNELHAEQLRNRRLRTLSGILAVLLVLTGVTGAIALRQSQLAQAQRDLATARQLAAESEAVTDRDPQLATLLSLAAFNVADIQETRSGVLNQLHRIDRVEKFLAGHTIAANGVAFSPDGATLASAGGDGKVIIWDVATQTARATLNGHTAAANSVAFSPDGRTLATGSSDRTTRLWDTTTGTPRATLTGHTEEVRSAVFSPDGRTLATGSSDRTIVLWDTATGTPRGTLTGHMDGVRSLAFSPDGATLASASFGGAVIMWDVGQRTARTTLNRHNDAVLSVAFSPDGRTLATGSSDRTIVLWDAATGTPRTTLTGHRGEVTNVAFSPDGHTFASAGLDTQVVLWDTARNPLAQHTNSVFSVAFSPDGRSIATGGKDKTVVTWDVARRSPQASLPASDWVLDVAFSPDGRTVATGNLDGHVMLWDTGRNAAPTTLIGHKDWVLGVAFSPDGRILASAGYDSNDDGDGSVVLWDAVQRVPLTTLTGAHLAVGVTDIAFSRDGRLLAIGSKDATVELWDVASRTPLGTLTGHTGAIRSVDFAPDGATLASGGKDDVVMLWDVAKQTRLATLKGHTDEAYDVAFRPDGRTLASAGLDGKVIVWDVGEQTELASLTGHSGAVNGLAYSPDGGVLATAGDDQTTILWNPDVASARQKLCGILGRDLTGEEWTTYLGDQPQQPTCT